MSEFKYPDGYTPMTDAERRAIRDKHIDEFGQYVDQTDYDMVSEAIELAVLTRLPKPDAEPVAYVDYSQILELQRNGGGIVCGTYSERYGRTSPLYAHPPKDTAEREPIVWLCKTEFGEGVSYSNKFWEFHPDFYQGAQEKRPTAERDALVAEIQDRVEYTVWLDNDTKALLRRIRAHLVGGGE